MPETTTVESQTAENLAGRGIESTAIKPVGNEPITAWVPDEPQTGSRVSARDLLASHEVWLGSAAFFLAALGEALLFAEAWRWLGLGLLALGAIVGVLAWGGARFGAFASVSAGERWWKITWRRELIWRLLGITVSVLLSVGSIVAYICDPDAIFGLQGVLWLAGVAALLASCSRWYPSNLVSETDDNTSPSAPRTPRWSRILVFAGLITLSFVTRLAFLDELPWRLHFDEGIAYLEIMRFYGGRPISLFTTTWANTSLPSMWFGIESALMHISGPNLAGVRLGVALAGALTVVPVYGLVQLLAGRIAAMLAAFFVAVSAVYVHYSRVSIINVTTPLVWAICFYFLLKGLHSRRPGDFVWAGLAAGFSMYTYYGTRLLPYLLLAFFVYLFVFHFRAARECMGHFVLMTVGFLAGFGPLLGYFVLNPGMWTGRGLGILNVPPVIPTSWEAAVADWNILAPLAWQNFLGLSVLPGKDNVYFAPFLLPLEAVLLVLGTGILMWQWRQPASFLVLLWGLGVVFTGGTLLDASTVPNFAHWAPAFPAFYIALAMPLALWWGALIKACGRSQSWKTAGAVALGLFLLLDLGLNAYAYIVQYPPRVPADHSLEAAHGRFVESVPPNTIVVVVGPTWGWQPIDYPISEMMASQGSNLILTLNRDAELLQLAQPGRNLAFLFYNDMYDYLPVVQNYYPGGTPGELVAPNGVMIAKTYFVPASLLAK